MKEFVVILVVLYMCIKFPIILLFAALGIGMFYLFAFFADSAGKKTDQPENYEENHVEEAKEAGFYTREDGSVPDIPIPAGPIKVDPDETVTK